MKLGKITWRYLKLLLGVLFRRRIGGFHGDLMRYHGIFSRYMICNGETQLGWGWFFGGIYEVHTMNGDCGLFRKIVTKTLSDLMVLYSMDDEWGLWMGNTRYYIHNYMQRNGMTPSDQMQRMRHCQDLQVVKGLHPMKPFIGPWWYHHW